MGHAQKLLNLSVFFICLFFSDGMNLNVESKNIMKNKSEYVDKVPKNLQEEFGEAKRKFDEDVIRQCTSCLTVIPIDESLADHQNQCTFGELLMNYAWFQMTNDHNLKYALKNSTK